MCFIDNCQIKSFNYDIKFEIETVLSLHEVKEIMAALKLALKLDRLL